MGACAACGGTKSLRVSANSGRQALNYGGPFDTEATSREIASLEAERAEADFWRDPDGASAKLARLSALQGPLDRLAALESRLGDLQALCELGGEAPEDRELLGEAEATIAECRRTADLLEMEVLLDGPHDRGDAIVEIHAGAGGTESQDWAQMLLRMYRRWCEDHRLRMEVIDALPGEEAGLRRVTVSVRGPNAFGLLRAEHGVHRLVRMSPFDASGRRHTSFASVDVLPDVPESEVEIRPEDLEIDTHRSSGAGGQHVNRTDSAVRIRHVPTGIVVTCQNERSQHGNRLLAMQVLRARLAAVAEAERDKALEALRGPVGEIAFGNHMRSYVFAPYTMVKDLRTDVETGDVQSVMDGALDPFIQAYLVAKRRGTLQGV